MEWKDPMGLVEEYRFYMLGTLFLLTLADWFAEIILKHARIIQETISNLVIFIVGQSLNRFVANGFQLAGLIYLERFQVYHFKSGWLTFLICIIGVDLFYYWRHRIEHAVNLLWAEHSVHHSSNEFNFSTSLRAPWVLPFIGWIAWAPMVLIGFDGHLVFSAWLVNLFYQFSVHNQLIGKMNPVVEFVFNTPSHHRVHHGTNETYLDKNFGGIFIVWDRLFGTFVPETHKAVYGSLPPVNTVNPFWINLIPWNRLLSGFIAQSSFLKKLKFLFGSPQA